MLSHVTQPLVNKSADYTGQLFALKVVEYYLPQDLQTGIFLSLMKFSANQTVCIGR